MNSLTTLVRSLAARLGALSPNCREASRLQSDALDRPLSRFQRLGLRIHLVLCRWCRRYGKQIRLVRQAVRDQPEGMNEASTQTLAPQVRERIKRILRDENL